MSKKKKKEMMIVLIMFLVLIVFAVSYVVLNQHNKKKEEEESATINLLTLDSSLATEVSISNSNGDFKFVKTDGAWKLDGDDSFIVDEDALNTLLDEFSDIEAVKMVTNSKDNLSDYGLEEPQAVGTIVLSDGTTAVISLGSEVPVAGGYYGMLEDNNSVYTFSADVFTSLLADKSEFQSEAASASPDVTPTADAEVSPEAAEG